MLLQARPKMVTEGRGFGLEPLSLWDRMQYAKWLLIFAGLFSFLGFICVAVGLTGLWVAGANLGLGAVMVDPLFLSGIVFIGFGVMLGFFGGAVKGPSVEWSAVAPSPPVVSGNFPNPPGVRYACPGCGGDVYTSQTVCPECGFGLPAAHGSTG